MSLLASEPVKLAYTELPGAVSACALAEHYKLYLSYREMLQRVDSGLEQANRPEKHQAESAYSSLLWGQSWALSGAYLHELYFQNLTCIARIMLLLNIEGKIEKKWGSQDVFWQDFTSAAMQSRGWTILAVCNECPDDLRIFVLDAHDLGAVYGYTPLLVIDVYEHAWWMDHGTERGEYLKNIRRFVDWMEVERRYLRIHGQSLYGR